MSILIRGMEMPTKENFVILINPQGGVWMIGDIPNEDTYLVKANAVPVPPHGRLIDEQWLKNAMITTLESLRKNPKMDMQEMHLIAAFNTLRAMVEDAPTIIPAEEG